MIQTKKQAILTTPQLIELIEHTNDLGEIIDLEDITRERRRVAIALHPDKTGGDAKALEAFKTFNRMMTYYEDGHAYDDELGQYRFNGHWLKYSVKEDKQVALLRNSVSYYSKIDNNGKNDEIRLYLPSRYKTDSYSKIPVKLEISLDDRSILASGTTLPQEHVNWVFSRLLGFTAMLHDLGMSHNGINPGSVLIVPRTHGIILTSFYHSTTLNGTVRTINGECKSWYPNRLFTEKKAIQLVDIELCKRMAAYLLGDKTGLGVSIRHKFNKDFMDFILSVHTDSAQAYREYVPMIEKNFEKKFIPLKI